MLVFPLFYLLFLNRMETNEGQVLLKESIIVEFQPDKVASVNSYMHYLGEIPAMKKSSFCFRMNLDQLRLGMPIISYATEHYDNDFLVFIAGSGQYEFNCCNDTSFKQQYDIDLNFLQWYSYCQSLDLNKREFTLVIDGKIITRNVKIFENSNKEPIISKGGILYLAQDQDTFGGTFSAFQSIRGKLADLFLIADTMSETDMIDYTTCRTNYFEYNTVLLNFQNASDIFNSSKVNIYKEKNVKTLCGAEDKRRVILTEPRLAEDAIKSCEAIGAILTLPTDHEDNMNLFALSSKFSKECLITNTDIIWLGTVYNEKQKEWIDVDSKKALTYNNFWASYGYSSTERCASMYGILEDSPLWYGKWDHTVCDTDKCSPCEFQSVAFLKMRGFCKKSYFDRQFYVIQENKTTKFLGNKYSVIVPLPPDNTAANDYGHWEIRRFDMPRVRAIMKKTFISHMPTGKNTWDVSNDRCGVIKSDLVLTICKLGEFSCADGSCIPLTERCNLETNCPDGSDEDDCSPLILPEKYSAKISPPRESPSIPLQIKISVDINAIRSFELVNFRIVSEITITTTWIDKRVKFKNLKKFTTLNNMQAASEKPWIPGMRFTSEGNVTSDVVERQFSLLAERLSDPLEDDDQNFREDEIFLGSKNPLVMKNTYTITTVCNFDLAFFPFDIQFCKMIILMTDTTNNYAEFVLDKNSVNFLGERRLLEYYVSSFDNEIYTQGLFSGMKVNIVFRNLFMYYMTSTFIPTLIMMVIGSSAFFFPMEDFQDRAMVSLTSLLVEATLFSQVSASIPKTAYLKFIDMWFVFCIFELFMVNIILTIINYFYEKFNDFDEVAPINVKPVFGNQKSIAIGKNFKQKFSKNKKYFAKTLNRWMQIIFPLVLMLFVAIYSLLAVKNLSI